MLELSRRTERIYRQRSAEEGTAVFGGVDGAAGGELRCGPGALRFYSGRKRTLVLDLPLADVQGVELRRKGSMSSVALVEVRAGAGRVFPLEIADGPRLAEALKTAGVNVRLEGW